jgi:tetratricopeptide (TPR) repeat protein
MSMADTNAEQGRQDEQPAPTKQPAPATKGSLLAAKKAAKAAKKAAKRGRQGEIRESEAIRASAQVASYLREQRGVLLAVAAGLLVIGGGLAAYFVLTGKQDRAATEQLWFATQAATAPLEGEGGDADEVFTSVRARANAAAERFEQVIAEHPRSRAAAWARVGQGTALLQAEDADGALQQFQAALDGADSVVLRWRAIEGLAFAHELREDWAAAAQQFEAMAGLDDARIQLQAQYHLARLERIRGNEDAALAALQKVRDALRDDGAPDLPYLSDQVDQLIRRIDPTAIPASASGGQPQLSPQEMQELMRRLQESGGAGGGLE